MATHIDKISLPILVIRLLVYSVLMYVNICSFSFCIGIEYVAVQLLLQHGETLYLNR